MRIHRDLPFRIDEWTSDGNAIHEVLAAAGNYIVAEAAFDKINELRPGRRITLRQGARVMKRSEEELKACAKPNDEIQNNSDTEEHRHG